MRELGMSCFYPSSFCLMIIISEVCLMTMTMIMIIMMKNNNANGVISNPFLFDDDDDSCSIVQDSGQTSRW